MQDHYFKILEKLSSYNYLLNHVINRDNITEYSYILNNNKSITTFVKLFTAEHTQEVTKIQHHVTLYNRYIISIKKFNI